MIVYLVKAEPVYPQDRACMHAPALTLAPRDPSHRCGAPSVARVNAVHLCSRHVDEWIHVGHSPTTRPYWVDEWFQFGPPCELRVPLTGRVTVVAAVGVALCTYVANRGIVEFSVVGSQARTDAC